MTILAWLNQSKNNRQHRLLAGNKLLQCGNHITYRPANLRWGIWVRFENDGAIFVQSMITYTVYSIYNIYTHKASENWGNFLTLEAYFLMGRLLESRPEWIEWLTAVGRSDQRFQRQHQINQCLCVYYLSSMMKAWQAAQIVGLWAINAQGGGALSKNTPLGSTK